MYSCGTKEDTISIVAQAADKDISYAEFYENFMLYPEFRNNSTIEDARLQHLQHMIESKLISQVARQDSLINEKEIQERLQYIFNRELLKSLYTKDILDKIELSDEELWEEYKRNNIELKIRHLFSNDRETVESFYQRLQKGEDFQQLAGECFTDSALAASGGDLGFIRLTDLDPLLVDSVYAQRIGSYSEPLRSSYGFHIIKIDEVKRMIFLTEDEFQANKDLYQSSLQTRQAKMRSRQYLAETLKDKSVTIKQQILNAFLRYTRQAIKMEERQQAMIMFTPEVTNDELRTISLEASDILSSDLVEFTDGSWTVADFIDRVRKMPPLHRPGLTQKDKLIKHIIDMVRDHFLLDIAISKRIDEDPVFQRRLSYEQDLYLADEFRMRIMLVEYQRENRSLWEKRRSNLAEFKKRVTVTVDTSQLFQDLDDLQRFKKIPKIRTVIRNRYTW
jgi:parvulin-like peptidyl-prolyl isomerase